MGQPVMQFQIVARNPEKAAEFYAKVFDWKIDANNALNYRAVSTGTKRGIHGGIWPAPPEGHGFVQLFIEVDDVAAYVSKASKHGGKTIIPPQKLPDGDEMAIILDADGISVGLFKPAK
ncbi:MAG: VOC family protein [Planctomycetes bacterium]|nr:VOC family protein [Planctomycetota bacterium]